MVSVATGVMIPLICKLTILAGEEYRKLKGLHDDALFLKNELSSINATLIKLADMDDDLDVQVKEWRNQVLELSYDIEDCIDDFMHRVDSNADKHGGIKGLFQKHIHKLKTLGARHDIAEQIRKLKIRVDSVSERHRRYNFDDTNSSSTGVVPIDPRLPALYADAESLVGIDGPTEELVRLLTEGEEESVKKLKVVAIVGFGGLGKTTLASQVYSKLRGQFECQAFVSVSHKPDMIKLFSKILSEVTGQQYIHPYDAQDLINELKSYLLHKRYIIVIDDLWDVQAWDIINCAFPKNNNGSKVITTTRIETVAKASCGYCDKYVYKMRPLNDQDSRRLFLNRIFGSEDDCPLQFEEVCTGILKKCCGLPLAISTIASLLASQPTKLMDQWVSVRNSLGGMFAENPSLEGMRQILNLSYKHLPHYLKTCLIYLGVYPEDYDIRKEDLMRQWVAEGLVSNMSGRDAYDVAESYFNELLNRNMITARYSHCSDEVQACRVHDMMLDLIIQKCEEQNFIAVIDDSQGMTRLHDRIRRLSMNFDGAKDVKLQATISLGQVRSLAVFKISRCMPTLLDFKYLRVMLLEFSVSSDDIVFDLTGMCELFQLRYLKIAVRLRSDKCTPLELPSQISKLQHLETLDVGEIISVGFPSDIILLPRLSHLVLPWKNKIRLPEGIGRMKFLRTLKNFDLAGNTLDNIKGLGELSNLRDLSVSCRNTESLGDTARRMDALRSSLEKLATCKALRLRHVDFPPSICGDGLMSSLSPIPQHLHTLDMHGCYFSRMPEWIGELHSLRNLSVMVIEVSKGDVHVLAELPALISMKMWVRCAPKERLVICGTGFRVLKHFLFHGRTPCLTLEAGAMPRLQAILIGFIPKKWEQYGTVPVGIHNLLSLKTFQVIMGCRHAEESEIRAAESAMCSVECPGRVPRAEVTCMIDSWCNFCDEDYELKGGMSNEQQQFNATR